MALKQTPPTWTAVTTGSDEYSVELNDANLETKAWKSSRYDGSRTITQRLNKYSDNDKTYGKTAATQKYSRNIYIGNGIIGMDTDSSEDVTLVNFPYHSYATTNQFITVNEDDSVSTTKLEFIDGNDNSKKIGFYRSFYEDFPIENKCQISINDNTVRNFLSDNHNIYFNGGILQKLLHIQSGNYSNVGPSQDFSLISFITASIKESVLSSTSYDNASNPSDFNTPFGYRGELLLVASSSTGNFTDSTSTHTGSLFNQEIYQNWFTGSLEKNVTVFGVKPGDSYSTKVFSFAGVYDFLNNFFNYQYNSNYKGDKRMFITMVEPHTVEELESGFNNQPIYTYRSGSYVTEGFISNRLSELSTVEINELNSGSIAVGNLGQLGLLTSNINNLPFNYCTTGSLSYITSKVGQPNAFREGGVIFSKTEDSIPSLLLNLNKARELPDGLGSKGFVIIPENLHPHIRKNLTHFLSKAGISLNVDVVPVLDNTFKKLK